MDNERHHEIIHVESPSVFESKIRLNVFVASVKSSSKVLFFFSLHEEFKQLLDNLLVVSFLSSLNSISEDLILLRKIDALLEFTVLTIKKSCNTSELQQMMIFSCFSQVVRINIGIFLN